MSRSTLAWPAALLALAGCTADIRLQLETDPAEQDALAQELRYVRVVVHSAQGFPGATAEEGTGGAEGIDWDGDGQLELVFTRQIHGVPVISFEVKKYGGRDLEFRVLGYDGSDQAIAYGGGAAVAPRSGSVEVHVPFRLRAAARRPQVVGVVPPDGATQVPRNLAGVVLFFSTTLDPATIGAIRLVGPKGEVPFVPSLESIVSQDGPAPEERTRLVLWLDPAPLDYAASPYQVQVGAGLRSLAGLPFDQKSGTPETDAFASRFSVGSAAVFTNGCECPAGYVCAGQGGGCLPAGGCAGGCRAGFICDPGVDACVEDCRPYGLCMRAGEQCDADLGLCLTAAGATASAAGQGLSQGHVFFTGDFDGDGTADIGFYQVADGSFWLGSWRDGQLAWRSVSSGVVGLSASFGRGKGRLWAGNFKDPGRTDLLAYDDASGSWYLGTLTGDLLDWSLAANTMGGDGHGINFDALLQRGHAVWIADFRGRGTDDVLYYDDLFGDWWLGTFSPTVQWISWSRLTPGNTQLSDVATHSVLYLSGRAIVLEHPFWIGDFDGDGRTDALFDDWVGTTAGSVTPGPTTFQWRPFPGATVAADQTVPLISWLDGAQRVWPADFTGDGKADLLFHDDRDGSWWLGASTGTGFTWNPVASTGTAAGGGNLGPVLQGGHRIWIGDFTGSGKAQVLIYSDASGDWRIGSYDGTLLGWAPAGNSRGGGNVDLGPLLDGKHLLWTGGFAGPGKTALLMYSSSDRAWWRGSFGGGRLAWEQVSSSPDLGDLTR